MNDQNSDNNNNSADAERRRFVRIPFSFPVRFMECGYDKKHLKEGGSSNYAYSNNISSGGIQLKLPQKLKLGLILKIKLTLPIYSDCKVLHLLGQVIWAKLDETDNKYAAGIQFIDLDDINQITLEEFIHESLKDNQ